MLGFAATPTPPGWAIVTSANTSATQTNYLKGVMCASANDCWAVGYYNNGSGGSGVAQTLVEHWDGISWAIVFSPNTSATQTNYLNSVTCTSAANCWAAGYYFNGSGVAQTLVEHWDGTSWAIAPSNNSSAAQNNYLYGVTCASGANCWAVGYFFNGSTTQGLIERWDGTAWAIAISPSTANRLFGVTCGLAPECWAVGDYFPSGHAQTLIERWDGTSWAIVSSPNSNPAQDNTLYSVTCVGPDCWAVGSYDPGGDTSLSLIERWNGASLCPSCPMWSIVSSPNNGPTYLNDVTCTSATNCWAVGYYFDNETTFRYYSLIQQWNGTSWAIVTSPNKPSPNNNYLYGVTCASPSECWAVGYAGYFQSGINYAQTLVEEYSPTIPPLTAIGSRKIHGSTPFDVDLLNASPGIECRSPGATGTAGVDYKIVFSFVNSLTSCGTASTGSLSNGPGVNQCTVNLTSVANQQYVTIALNNVLDSQNNSGNVAATMGVLVGDVNSTKRTDSGDVTAVRNHTVSIPDMQTFRFDVDASGRIDAGDVTTTRNATVTVLP